MMQWTGHWILIGRRSANGPWVAHRKCLFVPVGNERPVWGARRFFQPPIIRAYALGSCARAHVRASDPAPNLVLPGCPQTSLPSLRPVIPVLHTSSQLAGAMSSCVLLEYIRKCYCGTAGAHALVPRALVCWLAAPWQCPASLVLLAAILSLTLNIPAYRFSLVTCAPLLMLSTTRSVLVYRPGPELASGSSIHCRTGGR